MSEAVDLGNHRSRLIREAVLLTGSSADAEDLVQRTLERGLSARASRFERPLAWLRRTMRNLHIDQIRRRRVRERHAHRVEPPAASRSGAKVEARMDVGAALAELPPEQAQALLLVLGERYTYAEVAELQRVPINTVKSRVGRARARLTALLSEET